MANHPNRSRSARNADAGFFEDWSEWATWIFPEPALSRYIVHVATSTGVDMVSRIPGTTAQRRDRMDVSNFAWIVPADGWRHLRKVAPTIAAADNSKVARQQAASRRLDAANQEQWQKHKAEMATADPLLRELCERINEIADAMLRDRIHVTPWEHDFMAPIIDKLWRYGPALRVSDKQRAVIDRIYSKVGK